MKTHLLTNQKARTTILLWNTKLKKDQKNVLKVFLFKNMHWRMLLKYSADVSQYNTT